MGHQAQETLRNYHVDKAFISCKGADRNNGVTDSSENHSLNKQAMLRSARQTFLCLDGSKFDKTSFVKITDFPALAAVVTNRKPDAAWQNFFRELQIPCYSPAQDVG